MSHNKLVIDFEKITPNVAIQCATEEEANIFLDELENRRYRWANGNKPSEYTKWDVHKENTCYIVQNVGITYTSAKVINKPIIKFSDLLITNEQNSETEDKNLNKATDTNCVDYKPIKDWTLEELKEYCENNIRVNCGDCPFIDNCNKINSSSPTVDKAPHSWDLRQYWTKEEVQFVKLLSNYVNNPEDIILKKYEDGVLEWMDTKNCKIYNITKELFPSIKSNMRIRLIDIVENKL